jgi:hypothetical protein
MAARSKRSKNESSGFLSYLNPLSYIVSETPIEGEDAEGELSGINVVKVFGIPLFKKDSPADVPEDVLPPLEEINNPTPKSESSGGFFSGLWNALNPFSSGR